MHGNPNIKFYPLSVVVPPYFCTPAILNFIWAQNIFATEIFFGTHKIYLYVNPKIRPKRSKNYRKIKTRV